MISKLKQPKKYVHSSLRKSSQEDEEADFDGKEPIKKQKTKQIGKLHDKKKINKKDEPSALRLAAINETFHKIESNAEMMMKSFDIDEKLFHDFIQYKEKVKCKCQRNIRFYCLKCMSKNEELKFPHIELPFNIKVVHHQSQKIKKSSIAPMALLSDQVSLQTFYSNSPPESLLKDIQPKETLILFPHKNSKKVSEINYKDIKNVVVLDCTWFQTDQLVSCLEKQGHQNFVRLEDYESLYWRYNHHSDKALSSAEALAYFLREFQTHNNLNKTEYDDLMFLYLLNLKIIQNSYRQESKNQQIEEEPSKNEPKPQIKSMGNDQ